MAATSRNFLKTFCTATAICAVLVCTGYAGLFSYIERHFYEPAMTSYLNEQIQTLAEEVSSYTDRQIALFTLFSGNSTIRRSVLPEQTSEYFIERGTLAESLLAETPGLQGIRIIDSKGKHIYYSTFPADFEGRKEHIVSYINYPDSELNFDTIAAPEEIGSHITLDEDRNLLIFAYPFYDTDITYKGTIAFYVDPKPMQQYILASHFKSERPNVQLINNFDESKPYGIVFGLPKAEIGTFSDQLISLWEAPHSSGFIDDKASSSTMFVSFTETESIGFVAKAYPQSILALPENFPLLICGALCILIYIIAFSLYASSRHPCTAKTESPITEMQEKIISHTVFPPSGNEYEAIAAQSAVSNSEKTDPPEIKTLPKTKETVPLHDVPAEESAQQSQTLVRIVEDAQPQQKPEQINAIPVLTALSPAANKSAAEKDLATAKSANTAHKAYPAETTLRELAQNLKESTPRLVIKNIVPAEPEITAAKQVTSESIIQHPYSAENTHKNGGLLHKVTEYIEHVQSPENEPIQQESPLHSMTLPGYRNNYFSLVDSKKAEIAITTVDELDDIEQIQQQTTNKGEQTMYSSSAILTYPITNEPVQELIPLEENTVNSSIFTFHTNNFKPRFQVQSEDKQQTEDNSIMIEDGVYRISNTANKKPADINYEFKRLVDSVLHG